MKSSVFVAEITFYLRLRVLIFILCSKQAVKSGQPLFNNIYELKRLNCLCRWWAQPSRPASTWTDMLAELKAPNGVLRIFFSYGSKNITEFATERLALRQSWLRWNRFRKKKMIAILFSNVEQNISLMRHVLHNVRFHGA